jgi:hypothetical protein
MEVSSAGLAVSWMQRGAKDLDTLMMGHEVTSSDQMPFSKRGTEVDLLGR